tara:strand:+ start:675 stop:1526 length:852 start_codon:yes stop_codon:yes gene_type:complete
MVDFFSKFKSEMQISFDNLIEEDKIFQDVTTDYLEINEKSISEITSRANGFVSGISIVKFFFNHLNLDYRIVHEVQDGDFVSKNDMFFSFILNGPDALRTERIVLNLITRCSSICSEVNKWKKVTDLYGVKLLDTRKTAPGNRYFDKHSVLIGGGNNHRFNLEDEVLIKENHLVFFKNLSSAIQNIQKNNKSKTVVVEVESMKQLQEIYKLDFDRVIFDNWKYEKISEGIKVARSGNKKVELSGGINLSNLNSYCLLKPDFVSASSVTNPSKDFDISMLIKRY